ncbi:hypothetical protein QUV83_10210 [Cellulomonas cellasea]|uniref:hypothetical protein n=1 Tax=Cellulomonas cellasea TaxID=43670 RepID=UPI0025A3E288|nr:hypothetical protein [Cellulomonas cellasea]MDM8085138.1 hypothetical protein [Cellulomonas cellasea]
MTDPGHTGRDLRRWVQRQAAAIELVPAERVPPGREPDPDEAWRIYGDARWDGRVPVGLEEDCRDDD